MFISDYAIIFLKALKKLNYSQIKPGKALNNYEILSLKTGKTIDKAVIFTISGLHQ